MLQLHALLIDNYDSFTFNLYQALARLTSVAPVVVRNDELTWDELRAERFDAVIISPGPGRPDDERDFGICHRVIRELDVPLLGVCLGHQGIGYTFGGTVGRAPEPMHGRISRIHHDGSDLFSAVPSPFDAVRYHSLIVNEPLPECLVKTAWSEDRLVMAVRHRWRPVWGVQFHPESICTEVGEQILANFCRLAVGQRRPGARSVAPVAARAPRLETSQRDGKVFVRKRAGAVDAESAFRRLRAGEPWSFWLDSSMVGEQGARYSIIGSVGRDGEIVRYSADRGIVTVERRGAVEEIRRPLFEYLRESLAQRAVAVAPELPFDFNCGYVGYFGYELKADCGGRVAFSAPQTDCVLLFVDQCVVVDHMADETYLLWHGSADAEVAAREWFARTEAALAAPVAERSWMPAPADLPHLVPDQSKERYCDNIRRCLEFIRAGESYEICLTNTFRGHTNVDPFEYYCMLRAVNPAPYSAFLQLGAVAVACSSPERFLKIRPDGRVETKPIKGTARRGATTVEDAALAAELHSSVKSRAENLMIVDLLRNDLGRVCRIGSIGVPKLMHVETYATVHQLVSTVTGTLSDNVGAVDCLQHAFPGGSMTGAPKLRTLEIIDRLESSARGIYSGSIAFLALNGSADSNIVIRTAVFEGGHVSIGTGGAIVAQSDPVSEWQELLLKITALERTFQVFATQPAATAMIE